MNLFSILAISEHCLHEEQLDFFKTVTGDSYNYTAVSANNNPPLLSGKPAHEGVALFWKLSFDDFISPLKNINSDGIVRIRCGFPYSTPLFILSVYLPSASHNITEFNEHFDHLWALYDSLSANWFVIVMGDFNGDLGNSLGDKAKHEPNQRGLKLLDFANYFNLCPINLMGTCHGPTETYFSHCGRYRSTLDYIFLPNSLSEKIISAKTFGMYVDNISDHVPVQVAINYTDSITSSNLVNEQSSIPKPKVHWTKFTKDEINENYTAPLLTNLLNINLDLLNGTENDVNTISNLILTNSKSLAASVYHKKNKKKNYVSLPVDVKSARKQCKATFEFWKNNGFSTTGDLHNEYRTKRREYRRSLRTFLNQIESENIKRLCVASETDEKLFWKLIKGQRFTSQMSAFLVDGNILTDKNKIREMWADHFESLGTPSDSSNFDNGFCHRVTTRVQEIFKTCIEDPSGALCEPLEYEEVAHVCSRLKLGVASISIDYEHIPYAGPPTLESSILLVQGFL